MELDQFPTNETGRNMMKTITGNGFYDQSYVAKWLFQVMGQEIEDAKKLYDELRLQCFPETATWGLIYHEQKYGIPTNHALSMEQRRREILKKRGSRLLMNPANLEMQVAILAQLNWSEVEVIEQVEPYTFRVDVKERDTVPPLYQEIKKYIRQVKPSHLAFWIRAISFFEFRWKNGVELRKVVFRMNCDWMDVLKFDGRFRWDGTRRFHALESKRKTSLYEVRTGNQMTFSAEENVTATIVTKKNVWRFDGSYRMNGVQKWNAYQKEEEL